MTGCHDSNAGCTFFGCDAVAKVACCDYKCYFCSELLQLHPYAGWSRWQLILPFRNFKCPHCFEVFLKPIESLTWIPWSDWMSSKRIRSRKIDGAIASIVKRSDGWIKRVSQTSSQFRTRMSRWMLGICSPLGLDVVAKVVPSKYKCSFCSEHLHLHPYVGWSRLLTILPFRNFKCPHCFEIFRKPIESLSWLSLPSSFSSKRIRSRSIDKAGRAASKTSDRLERNVFLVLSRFGKKVSDWEQAAWSRSVKLFEFLNPFSRKRRRTRSESSRSRNRRSRND